MVSPPNFEDDTSFTPRVYEIIHKLNHIEFLELYENSSRKLKIRPLITAKDYKKFQKRCYKNHRKLVERNFLG